MQFKIVTSARVKTTVLNVISITAHQVIIVDAIPNKIDVHQTSKIMKKYII